jgi:hypothetical protein
VSEIGHRESLPRTGIIERIKPLHAYVHGTRARGVHRVLDSGLLGYR